MALVCAHACAGVQAIADTNERTSCEDASVNYHITPCKTIRHQRPVQTCHATSFVRKGTTELEQCTDVLLT